jgi:hypothetical protein
VGCCGVPASGIVLVLRTGEASDCRGGREAGERDDGGAFSISDVDGDGAGEE